MRFQLIAYSCNCEAYAEAVRAKGHEVVIHPVSDRFWNLLPAIMDDIKSKINSNPSATWLIAEPAFAHMIEDSIDFPFNRNRMYLNLLPKKNSAFYDPIGTVYNMFERKSFVNKVRSRTHRRAADETRIYKQRDEAKANRARPLVPDPYFDDPAFLIGRLLIEGL